jgi:Phage integrase family
MCIVAQMKPLVAHLVRIPKDETLPLQHWAIDGLPRLNGKRQRKFFRTKDAAERALASVKVKLRKEGEKALLITDTLRIEAVDCFKLLKPYGASLKEAVRFYIAHHEAASKSCTVEAAVDEYLKIQRLKRRSDRHIADLKYRLGVFKERFGTILISSLSVHDSEKWLHGLGQSPMSLNNFHIAVSALLDWSDVDLTRGFVEIAAEQAKGARRRLVEMSANLKAWLVADDARSGKLWPWSHKEYYRRLEAARIKAGISKWPSNALRHSYASYHLAYHQNAAALALQMGHTSQAMIFSNYREVVTRQDAERYWAIKPARAAATVIPMTAKT